MGEVGCTEGRGLGRHSRQNPLPKVKLGASEVLAKSPQSRQR